MNILIISNYPNKTYQESYIFVHNQAKALQNSGHKVVVLDIDIRSLKWPRKYGFYNEIYEEIPVYHFSLPLLTKFPRFVKIINNLVINKLYKKALKDFSKFDLINVHFGMSSGSAGIFLKNKYKLPLIITEHFSGILKKDLKKLNFVKRIYEKSDTVIAVGEKLKQKIISLGINNVTKIPNIIDTKKFIVENSFHQDFTFLSIGRLTKDKRHDLTITAFQNLLKKYPNIKLKIIGKGREKTNLLSKISNDNIKNIEIIDIIPNAKLPSIYNQSDCFVLPSNLETFGVVYIEAISCGTPVIATKCGGPEEFVNSENGILIEKDNLTELENAMEKMINNSKKYNSKEMHQFISDNYGEESFIKKINQIYSKIRKD